MGRSKSWWEEYALVIVPPATSSCIAGTLMESGGWRSSGLRAFPVSPQTSLYPTCFVLDLAS